MTSISYRMTVIDIAICFCSYPTALELVTTGKVNVKPLVTHHYTMEETQKAFQTAQDTTANAIKVMIHANPSWKK